MPKTVQYTAMIGVFIAGIVVARLWSSVFLLALACFLAGALMGAGGLYWYANGVWRRNPYAFRAIVDRVIAYREQNQGSEQERKERSEQELTRLLDACSDGYDPAVRTKWEGIV